MDSSDTRLNLSELFVSIQGEGRYLGMASFFVRTSGCNLRCQWNGTRCDTPYTSWEARGETISVGELRRRIGALRREYPLVRHLVVTGGEPLLQPGVEALCKVLHDDGFFITVETNGTIARELAVDFVSLSPKLASSVPPDSRWREVHEQTRCQPDVLRHWVTRYEFQFKFVVNEPADEAEIDDLLAGLGVEIPPDAVFLMPQGVNADQLAEHARLCVEICLRRGWRFTPRAHIEIYGNRAGT